MLSEALHVPFTDIRKFLVGAAAYAVPYLNILTVIFAYGYLARYLRQILRMRSPRLPQWSDAAQLFLDGLRVFAIGLIYLIPWALFLVVIVTGVVLAQVPIEGTLYYLFIVIFALCALGAWYIIPVAILEFLNTNVLASALRLRDITRTLLTREYLSRWLTAFVISVVLSLLVLGLDYLLVTMLGSLGTGAEIAGLVLSAIITALVAFYQLLVVFTLYADGWMNAREGQLF